MALEFAKRKLEQEAEWDAAHVPQKRNRRLGFLSNRPYAEALIPRGAMHPLNIPHALGAGAC